MAEPVKKTGVKTNVAKPAAAPAAEDVSVDQIKSDAEAPAPEVGATGKESAGADSGTEGRKSRKAKSDTEGPNGCLTDPKCIRPPHPEVPNAHAHGLETGPVH